MEASLSLLFQQLGIALGLGLLVGLQRESAASQLAGVRTFPLVTLLGTISALLAQSLGGWVVAAGLLALAALIVIGKQAEVEAGKPDAGLTTEVAMLLMFGVGAYLVTGQRAVAIAIGGGTAVLLHFKGELHDAVARLSANDLRAIMQFALLSLVILPVLPNRTYGPYAVLNPRNIWFMVVLIVGISLSGYIVYKFFGEKAGLLLGGALGGLISSTATTVSYARRTAQVADASHPAAVVILIASAIVFVRVGLEIATVAPAFLRIAIWPLAALMATLVALVTLLWFWWRGQSDAMPAQENPSELKSALIFGALYAGILFAVAFVKETFGDRGLYFVAGLSGLTDVDAITLSTSQLVNLNRLDASSGWRLIVVATMSNLVFKAGTVVALGHRALALRVCACFGAVLLVGILFLWFWP
ncbi:MAG: MgtC/SapB family protein [Acidobacteriota bacterium]